MEEAIASSQLEGAATTRKSAKELLRSGRKPVNNAEQMILNNYQTIKEIGSYKDRLLDFELIKHIQGTLTRNTLDRPEYVGRFRTSEDKIDVIDIRDNEVLFTPPDASEIEARLNIFFQYVNTEEIDEFVHPVIKAVIIHFWFAYIHPFVDGNGRTARGLFYWYLLKRGYSNFEYLSISRILKNSPTQYAKAYLYSEIDDCDLTYFLVYNLRAIHLAINAFQVYLKNKQEEISEAARFIREYPDLNYRQHDLLCGAVADHAIRYTLKFVRNTYNVVYETARTDLAKLVKKGFFEKKKIGREYYFVPVEDIQKRVKGMKGGTL
jgi:Fic family protein